MKHSMKLTALISVLLLIAVEIFAASSGHGGDIHIPVKTIAFQFLNLGVLIGVIVWKAGPPIKQMFADRAAAYENELAEAKKAMAEAQQEKDTVQTRLQKLRTNSQTDLTRATDESVQEHGKKIQDTEGYVVKIKEDARTHVNGELMKLVEKLRIDTFEESVAQAEANLKKKNINTIKNSFSERMKGAMQ